MSEGFSEKGKGKDAKRLADDGIYLNQDRFEEPKEIFKLIGKRMKESGISGSFELLDVGCATGELIYYLKKEFADAKFTGIDVSEKMIALANKTLPSETFLVKDILNTAYESDKKYEVVACVGVLQIFDDLKTALNSLLSTVKEKGVLYIIGPFNEDPVDVLTRYRTVDPDYSEWQLGWNIFSKQSYERILKESAHKLSWKWQDFDMPFAMEKTDDPMRTWTIKTETNPNQLRNGNSQLINVKLLEIHFK